MYKDELIWVRKPRVTDDYMDTQSVTTFLHRKICQKCNFSIGLISVHMPWCLKILHLQSSRWQGSQKICESNLVCGYCVWLYNFLFQNMECVLRYILKCLKLGIHLTTLLLNSHSYCLSKSSAMWSRSSRFMCSDCMVWSSATIRRLTLYTMPVWKATEPLTFGGKNYNVAMK